MAKITLKDLADQLHLSPSTVSRALSNHSAISLETKIRVRKLAAELNYQPNVLAQGLQKKRITAVGVLVPEIRHYFFSAAISGIEEIMYDAGFTIMVCQSWEDNERENNSLEALVSHQIAGLLVSVSEKTRNSAPFQAVLEQGIPMVFFDRILDDIETDCVVVDDFNGAVEAMEYLIQSGYKQIAYIGGPKHLKINQDRLRGYKTVLRRYGLPVRKDWIVTAGLNEKDGENAARQLLRNRLPKAVFCINDPVAMGVYTVFRENHIRIPLDVAVVGFSDDPIGRLTHPSLTTMSQPATEMGKTAAKLLLEQISRSGDDFFPRTVTLKTRLIIREST